MDTVSYALGRGRDDWTVPPYDAHRGFLKSLWLVPTILGGLYAATLIGRFIADILYHLSEDAKERLRHVKTAAVGDGGGRGGAGPSGAIRRGGAGTTESPFGADSGFPGAVTGQPFTRSEQEIGPAEEETRPTEREDIQPETEDGTTTLLNRFERATAAARTAFLLSLLLATVGSIPIEYACLRSDPNVPGGPMPQPECRTCLTNAANLPMVIMSWVFLALSAIWILLNMSLTHLSSIEGVSTLMTLLAQPLVLAALIMGFRCWTSLRGRTC